MNIKNMHIISHDTRINRERLIELKEAFIAFKKTNDRKHAFTVMKNCLTLVNDVIEYSAPIKLDTYYSNHAKSFIEDSLDRSGRFNYFRDFDYEFNEYITLELSNDKAPRFYCNQWFSAVVGVLESQHGLTLDEIEHKYFEHITDTRFEQTSIYDFI